jgi:GT2 family glycosyltransferase
VNSVGDGLTTAGVGFNCGLGGNVLDFNVPELVFGVCGAAMSYRRRMFDEVGFLNREFFLYDEDTNTISVLSLPVGSVFYLPSAVAHHVANEAAKRLRGSACLH